MDGHVILNTQGVLDSAVAPAKGIRTGCPDAPSDGYVSHGALSSYEWLSETMVGDAAVRDRGKRLCRMIVGSDLLSLPLVFSFCRRFISGWIMLIIRMCCGDYPGVYALPASEIRMMMVRLITRATRHHELRATCFPRGGVPTILNPSQNVKFLLAITQLQLRVHSWGLQREDESRNA
ncbi:hypothetical protein CK203_016792 [Vitis vinifera]|uniref:Uncharacterized protein n=1 Tax=Vitis vinifera TaxID=29760 RepID=A0A438J245_VITVI|nr:hypothetical protein CK203_016792 [Vitis vinifera]